MATGMKIFLSCLGIIVGVALLLFVVEAFGIADIRIFGIAKENARREVFEQTKSYNEGKEQDLIRYRLQYLRETSDADKEAIASTIRLSFADYDISKLEPELRAFLKKILRGE